ncbi:MAG: carbamoyl-phosphate synthase domain-containing protein [Clostridia bacterium]
MIKTIEKMEGLIYLEDGTVFKGHGFGFKGTAVGELVFNTSMTGYQKILTDPSYKGQIINMTYPLIGNYGISKIDNESEKVHAFGLVVKDLCDAPSNSNSIMTIDEWLRNMEVPGCSECGYKTDNQEDKKQGNGQVRDKHRRHLDQRSCQEMLREAELRGDWMKEVGVKEKWLKSLAALG